MTIILTNIYLNSFIDVPLTFIKFQRDRCFRSAEKRRHVLKRYMRDYRGAFYSFHENAFSIEQLGDNLFLYGDLNEETRGRNSAEPPLLPSVSFCTDSFAFISI